MLIIVGTIRFPAEHIAEARIELGKVVTASRAEDGCEAYAFAEDILDPGLFHVSERWVDRVALKAHTTTPHFVAYRAASAALGVGDRDVRLYEAESFDPL
ncbi:MAG: putative quinol monooxygenase [Sphingomonadales bacterium]